MNRTVKKIASIITSLGMVIFVLLMTVIAMIFVGHGLYYKVFLDSMTPWQAEAAAWVLSFGVETTVLVITCNVKYFSSRHLPIFFAICSGFIVLFFINGFDVNKPVLDLAVRWFIALLVCGLNFTYSELFVKKYRELVAEANLQEEISVLRDANIHAHKEVEVLTAEVKTKDDRIAELSLLVDELDSFRKNEIAKLTCKSCGTLFPTVFHLNSHTRSCNVGGNDKETKEHVTLSIAVNQ